MNLDALSIGDMTPFFYGVTGAGAFYSFQAQAGRPVVLILGGALGAPTGADLMAAFSERLAAFTDAGADVLRLFGEDPLSVCGYHAAAQPAVMSVADAGDFFQRFPFDQDRLTVFVLDRAGRLIARYDAASDPSVVDAALAAILALPGEVPRAVVVAAPVLMIPNLIDRDLCRLLIERHEAGGHFDSGFATQDAEGVDRYATDHKIKKRRDHSFADDDPLHLHMLQLIFQRTAPEIKKAFQVDVAHVDRLLIARYDDDGGLFRRHRDNVQPALAFRQFAMSINLNAEDHDGGALLFPEYVDHAYAPPTGGALIFSASLLHEVTPVTRGSRYVLLTFLHNAEAELRRQALKA